MEFSYAVNLLFVFVLNVVFFFTGICLNSLVIVTFYRSPQLRRKLCYFMIMILSCCDSFVVLTGHPFIAVHAMLWLTGKLNGYPKWMEISTRVTSIFVAISFLALLVLSFDRYLAASRPIFHRTSVTKGRLLTLLIMLANLVLVLELLYESGVFMYNVSILIFFTCIFPPMLFINCKLFTISRKGRRNNVVSPEKRTFPIKTLSSCLLSVTCFFLLSIPAFVYTGLRVNFKDVTVLDGVSIVQLWARTMSAMNSTMNCLIFFWKNKILYTEGMRNFQSLRMNIASQAQTFSHLNGLWRWSGAYNFYTRKKEFAAILFITFLRLNQV